MLDSLYSSYPTMPVVQFGYDLLNLGGNSGSCDGYMDYFYGCNEDITCINTEFTKLQNWFVANITNRYEYHTALNLLGTLQMESGQ